MAWLLQCFSTGLALKAPAEEVNSRCEEKLCHCQVCSKMAFDLPVAAMGQKPSWAECFCGCFQMTTMIHVIDSCLIMWQFCSWVHYAVYIRVKKRVGNTNQTTAPVNASRRAGFNHETIMYMKCHSVKTCHRSEHEIKDRLSRTNIPHLWVSGDAGKRMIRRAPHNYTNLLMTAEFPFNLTLYLYISGLITRCCLNSLTIDLKRKEKNS